MIYIEKNSGKYYDDKSIRKMFLGELLDKMQDVYDNYFEEDGHFDFDSDIELLQLGMYGDIKDVIEELETGASVELDFEKEIDMLKRQLQATQDRIYQLEKEGE